MKSIASSIVDFDLVNVIGLKVLIRSFKLHYRLNDVNSWQEQVSMKLLLPLLIGAVMADMDPLMTWRNIPAWANSVTANEKEIWATNRFWQLFRCPRPCTGNWSYKGWFAGNVAMNQYEMWVIAVDGRIFRSKLPAHSNTFWWVGNGWGIANGILKSASLGSNMVAGVNPGNDAFMSPFEFANSTQTQPSWVHLPGKWRKVGVSADNELWGVATNGNVHKYSKRLRQWRQISNPTVIDFHSISVGRLHVYATDANFKIYRCLRPCKHGGWQQTSGLLRKVSLEQTGDSDTLFGINMHDQVWEGKLAPI